MIGIDLAAIFMFGIATFIFTKTLYEDDEQFKAQEVLEDQEKIEKTKNYGFILKVSRTFYKRLSPAVSSFKFKKKIREKYKRPLANGGISEIMTPEDFFAFKLFLVLGFPVLFVALRLFLEEDWSYSYIPIIAAFGFFYPDLWLKGLISKRNSEVLLGMPFIVDMLALSIEAGLDFVAAMQRVIEKAPPGPISEEFEILIKEIRVGASRAEALRNLSYRVDLTVVASFCATLIAADSVGASVGPILKNLSEDIRSKREAEVEKAGAKAASTMLVPMIFFVVPAVFLMIAAPLIVEAMANG